MQSKRETLIDFVMCLLHFTQLYLFFSVTMHESDDEPKDLIKVTYEKLSADEVSESVKSPSCGAVSLFIGKFYN
uniref:Uncharacterized protein n=1 Tax=Callorhinchus milii TaxID=7868 RepID=A0A4W3GBD1_CALMI